MTIMHGDCLEVLKTFPDNHFDLTITSPPYDDIRRYNGSLNFNEEIWQKTFIELYRLSKEGARVVWIINDSSKHFNKSCNSFKQALFAQKVGFKLNDTMIWEKTGKGAIGSNNFCYLQNFEYMFIFSKGTPKIFNPICDRKNKIIRKVLVNHHINTDGISKSRRVLTTKEYGRRFNIWKINPNSITTHPAEFPEKLAEDHILSWSNEGDLILDPFAGSGTVGTVAKKLNRDFVLIEKEKEYVEIAKARLVC